MAENPFEEFVKGLPTERKPLSETDRKEALRVADVIRDMAGKKVQAESERTSVKNFGSFVIENQDFKRKIDIWLGREETRGFKPKNSQTDLIIITKDFLKDQAGEVHNPMNILRVYLFAPSEVTVDETTFGGRMIEGAHIGLGSDADKIEVNFNDTKQTEHALNQNTHDSYQPNRAELGKLLSDLALAKPE